VPTGAASGFDVLDVMLMLPGWVGSMRFGTGCRQLEHMQLGAAGDIYSLATLTACATQRVE